jgi:hypothetical protein
MILINYLNFRWLNLESDLGSRPTLTVYQQSNNHVESNRLQLYYGLTNHVESNRFMDLLTVWHVPLHRLINRVACSTTRYWHTRGVIKISKLFLSSLLFSSLLFTFYLCLSGSTERNKRLVEKAWLQLSLKEERACKIIWSHLIGARSVEWSTSHAWQLHGVRVLYADARDMD